MKGNFTSYDVVCMTTELQRLIGMRVNQIYDIDNKTYLIRLQRGEEKCVLLLESGSRFHTTAFEWPKNVAPSGFTLKLRKHLKNKRLEKLEQLGVDRVINLQFGSGEATYHVVLELYDRGNIILADYEWNILNLLRPHTEGDRIRVAVREKYPLDRIKQESNPLSKDDLIKMFKNCKPGEKLSNILTISLDCGPVVVKHALMKFGLENHQIEGNPELEDTDNSKKGKQKKKKGDSGGNEIKKIFNPDTEMNALLDCLKEINEIMKIGKTTISKGFIIQKPEPKPSENGVEEIFYSNIEYHPMIFLQNKDRPHKEFENFNLAVDEFYSTLEGQKIDVKAIQQEREALKKLSNVKKDHSKRLEDLLKTQKFDAKKAELITRNQELVDKAILAIRSALANQMSWPDIQELVKAAQQNNDPVASKIKQLKLEINHISLYLTDPYAIDCDEDDEEENDDSEKEDEDDDKLPPMVIDIDLGLSAYANARKYHDQRRTAAKKEQKTIESSSKALKSAEKRTQQALKEVRTMTSIQKARKVYWFEKFYWFISSENYLVISGRDQQQNELIVKRYMRPTDIYVHADIQGATSVVIRNPTGEDIPPKTLLEAGTMAISYSIAWDAKVVTSAYWVKSDQVSKTAPTGEYLGTGSFMIRGKKNFLPPCHLILGLSFLFKLEDSSIERHKGERKIRNFDEDDQQKIRELTIENEQLDSVKEEDEDQEIELDGGDSDGDSDVEDKSKHSKKSNESDGDDSDDEDDSSPAFPDTQVKVEHDTGKVTVKVDPKIERLHSENENNENVLVYLGDDKPYVFKPLPPSKKQSNKKNSQQQQQQQQQVRSTKNENNEKDNNSSQSKRGQKGKLKKIKEKYKDQDEDERKMRMEILKSSGESKSSGGKKNKKKQEQEQRMKKVPGKKFEPKPRDENADEDNDEPPAAAEVDMLDSLTGKPVEEDELLFAIPVVAPYQTLQNYKYKVKLTPGTNRRGKAAKMAVQIFFKYKNCTQREKDLIKNVRDDMLARNIPGKVKLSAPHLQNVYK